MAKFNEILSDHIAKWNMVWFGLIFWGSVFNAVAKHYEILTSSLQTSGYHATDGEIQDEKKIGLLQTGGKIKFQKNTWHLAINSIYHKLDKPLYKAGNKYHKKKATNKKHATSGGTSQNAVDHPFGGSKSSHKGKPTVAPKNAPPGRKVGKVRPRRTGYRG